MTTHKKLIAFVTLSLSLLSCSSFNLSEHQGSLSVKKQRRAKDVICVVKPFTYNPSESGEEDLMSAPDLQRWQEMLADGLNQSNIVAEVVAQNGDHIQENAAYVIDGKVTRFYFKKNWVPTF